MGTDDRKARPSSSSHRSEGWARVINMATESAANVETASSVATAIAQTLEADAGYLYLVHSEAGTLQQALPRSPEIEGFPLQLPLDARHIAVRAAIERQPVLEVEEKTSRAAFPLVFCGEPIGVLAMPFAAAQAWSEMELQAAQAISNVLTLVLAASRAELRASLERASAARRAAAATKAISKGLLCVPEHQLQVALLRGFHVWPYAAAGTVRDFLAGALKLIVNEACTAVGARLGAIGIVTAVDEPFSPWVVVGVDAEQAAAIGRTPRPVGTLGVVALKGEALRVPDVRKHPDFSGFPPAHPEITSLLATPIHYGDVTLGDLYVGNKVGSDEFSAEDLEVLDAIADHAREALVIAFLRAAIDAQRAQLQSVIDCAPVGIAFIDAATRHVMANPRAMELFGITLVPERGTAQYASLVRYPDGLQVPTDDVPAHRALRGEEERNRELLIARRDGRKVPVLVNSAAVRTMDARIMGAVVVFEDVSAIKDLERLREEFLAVVAHDLRNPIHVIVMQAQALQSDIGSGGGRFSLDAIRRIERNAARLEELVSDLLDASQADLKRFSLDRRLAKLDELVAAAVERCRPLIGARPFEVTSEPDLPSVCVDARRFDQILTNLIDNALKYSPADALIAIHLAAARDGLLISVRDGGAGIATEEIPLLFDRFYQARRAREKKSGLGLGLFIVKALVEAHGGRISVESRVGMGSTFQVWLPRAVLEQAPGGST